ncbi:MAG: glycoside hydrolase family 130 protein [Calditrichia bacterium]|nr:glycoside hydrolase family 130 protein [Calditrichia bacterium]
MQNIKVNRRETRFSSDSSRVINKFYYPGNEQRARNIINRVLNLSDYTTLNLLEQILSRFEHRHRNLKNVFKRNYQNVAMFIPDQDHLSETRKLLIGSYFTHEYSVEAAGFFNPSMVIHPDQKNLQKGELRFIMSFRATGEGHVSSIEFRSGKLDKYNNMLLHRAYHRFETPEIIMKAIYEKKFFLEKIRQLRMGNDITKNIFIKLPSKFSFDELQNTIESVKNKYPDDHILRATVNEVYFLARSNHERYFRPESHISERVLFPVSKEAIKGLEDARFVCFHEDNGEIIYHATYTAFSGFEILPMMLRTKDFLSFNFCAMAGAVVKNKGMALFPRKIDGKYTMISRIDGENMYLMKSDSIDFWDKAHLFQKPKHPWEFFQIGNCGSPIETSEGWLLLTHGVGPMRTYCIGAELLDLKNPSKIIAQLPEPILMPLPREREGYVPNVVYSCGGMIHNNELVLPFAMSDSSCGVATINMDELMKAFAQSL